MVKTTYCNTECVIFPSSSVSGYREMVYFLSCFSGGFVSWYWDRNIIVPLGISPRFHLSQVLVVILGSERMEEASCYSKKLFNSKQLAQYVPMYED